MQLSQEQRNFFQTFGYLALPGALKTDVEWITDEFTGIHARAAGPKHDGSRRTCIVPFIDQSPKLCTLLDHPVVEGIASGLLGDDFNYIGGDGNYYTGNTGWHSDGWHDEATYIKIALYLDPVAKRYGLPARDTGQSRRRQSHSLLFAARQSIRIRVRDRAARRSLRTAGIAAGRCGRFQPQPATFRVRRGKFPAHVHPELM